MKWKCNESVPELGLMKGVTYDFNRDQFKRIDETQGRRRCTSAEREAFTQIDAAYSILQIHKDELENLCKHKRNDKDYTKCWQKLQSATGILRSAVYDMSCNMSALQVASLKEQTKEYRIAISQTANPGYLAVHGQDMTKLINIMQCDHCGCCTNCGNPKEWHHCPVYEAFESLAITIEERDDHIKGLCPYHLEKWATEEEMSLD